MNIEIDLQAVEVTGVLQQLTLEEKAVLCSGRDFWNLQGVGRLGIPSIMVSDGPHGLRKQLYTGNYVFSNNIPATCFPTAVTLASSWNRDLIRAVGVAIGEEARAEKVGVVLGPGINIKRSPLGGRNFEYFSEDPFLSGSLATAYIEGVQSTGIGASIKHFVANNQEYRRLSIDAIIDERALREIYLAGFEQAIKAARPWTVMAAYNRVNGVYCSENPFLLNKILREEWGFEGLVVSDWGAVNHRVNGLEAGMDLEMPGLNSARTQEIIQAVKAGILPEALLDQAAQRIVNLIDQVEESRYSYNGFAYSRKSHHDLASQAACEGAVLLKNDLEILPLSRDNTVAVIGAFAKSPRYQGAGSSLVTPSQLDCAYDAIAERIGPGGHLRYAAGYHLKSKKVDRKLIAEAQQAARGVDIVLVFAGLPDIDEVEGIDRQNMALPASHNALIEAIAKVNPNVVVILMNGAPVEMPWNERVPAILEAYLGGQGGGTAIAQLLFGEINPSGKLAETFPLHLEDHPAHALFPGGPRTVEYRESIYVGYRYYDSARKTVLFPFGHGLSYTRFEYSQLELNHAVIQDGNELQVSVTITNTGKRGGHEIVQLYIHDVASTVFRPEQELKEFSRVYLDPGESTTVYFSLNRRSFAYFDSRAHDWQVEPGRFEIRVGASSRDIRLRAEVEVRPGFPFDYVEPPRCEELDEYYHPADHTSFTREAFQVLYGRQLPQNEVDPRGCFTPNTPLSDMRGSPAAWIFRLLMHHIAKASINDEHDSPTARLTDHIIREMPLRMMLMSGNSKITPAIIDGLIFLMNGKLRKGLAAVRREFFGSHQ